MPARPAAGRGERDTSGPSFGGFPPDAHAFFAELAAENDKAFFDRNRHRYAASVRGPLDALLGVALDEFGPAKVFRPNRDIRFSHDKSPYKLAASAIVGGTRYVELDAGGLVAGGGIAHLSASQLRRFRLAVADDRRGGQLAALVDALRAEDLTVHGEELKRAPRGFAADHPRVVLLRHKMLLAVRQWDGEPWIATAEARERVFATWRRIGPLLDWLGEHVGSAEEHERGR